MFSKVITVEEDVDITAVSLSKLPTDSHFVHKEDGSVDIMRASKMVDIFDLYYDLGIPITKIEVVGGRVNPRLMPQSPKG